MKPGFFTHTHDKLPSPAAWLRLVADIVERELPNLKAEETCIAVTLAFKHPPEFALWLQTYNATSSEVTYLLETAAFASKDKGAQQ